VVIAVVVTVIVTYGLYSSTSTPVTWQAPTTPIDASPSKAPALTHIPTKDQTIPGTGNPPKNDKDHAQVPEIPNLVPTSVPDKIKTPDVVSSSSTAPKPTKVNCVKYEDLQRSKQQPWSTGWRKFPYSRPPPECRTFNLPAMEKLVDKMKAIIKDPDLARLFENSYPNTLDTMVKWRGYASKTDPETGNSTTTDEELTYVITGDIDAMWLRDSASQIYSYLPLLEASTDPNSLASLWRGLINIHARYIIISPYCHSFQPPPESGVKPTHNGAYAQNHPNPPYDPSKVFDCKWELDSLASFLQISVAYYERTQGLQIMDNRLSMSIADN
jgi:hypothetical protein